MPLIKSASKEAVGKNIAEMEAAGHPHDQSVAAALNTQREAKKHASHSVLAKYTQSWRSLKERKDYAAGEEANPSDLTKRAAVADRVLNDDLNARQPLGGSYSSRENILKRLKMRSQAMDAHEEARQAHEKQGSYNNMRHHEKMRDFHFNDSMWKQHDAPDEDFMPIISQRGIHHTSYHPVHMPLNDEAHAALGKYGHTQVVNALAQHGLSLLEKKGFSATPDTPPMILADMLDENGEDRIAEQIRASAKSAGMTEFSRKDAMTKYEGIHEQKTVAAETPGVGIHEQKTFLDVQKPAHPKTEEHKSRTKIPGAVKTQAPAGHKSQLIPNPVGKTGHAHVGAPGHSPRGDEETVTPQERAEFEKAWHRSLLKHMQSHMKRKDYAFMGNMNMALPSSKPKNYADAFPENMPPLPKKNTKGVYKLALEQAPQAKKARQAAKEFRKKNPEEFFGSSGPNDVGPEWEKYAEQQMPTHYAKPEPPMDPQTLRHLMARRHAEELAKMAETASGEAKREHDAYAGFGAREDYPERKHTHRDMAENARRMHERAAQKHKNASEALNAIGERAKAMNHDMHVKDHNYLLKSMKRRVAEHDNLANIVSGEARATLKKKHGVTVNEDIPHLILADVLADKGEHEHEQKIRTSEHISHMQRSLPTNYVKDKTGHEHKGGGPGGGQFAPGPSGGGQADQPTSNLNLALLKKILILSRHMNTKSHEEQQEELLDQVAGPRPASSAYARPPFDAKLSEQVAKQHANPLHRRKMNAIRTVQGSIPNAVGKNVSQIMGEKQRQGIANPKPYASTGVLQQIGKIGRDMRTVTRLAVRHFNRSKIGGAINKAVDKTTDVLGKGVVGAGRLAGKVAGGIRQRMQYERGEQYASMTEEHTDRGHIDASRVPKGQRRISDPNPPGSIGGTTERGERTTAPLSAEHPGVEGSPKESMGHNFPAGQLQRGAVNALKAPFAGLGKVVGAALKGEEMIGRGAVKGAKGLWNLANKPIPGSSKLMEGIGNAGAGIGKGILHGGLEALKAGATIAAGVATADDPEGRATLHRILKFHEKNKKVKEKGEKQGLLDAGKDVAAEKGRQHQLNLLAVKHANAMELQREKAKAAKGGKAPKDKEPEQPSVSPPGDKTQQDIKDAFERAWVARQQARQKGAPIPPGKGGGKIGSDPELWGTAPPGGKIDTRVPGDELSGDEAPPSSVGKATAPGSTPGSASTETGAVDKTAQSPPKVVSGAGVQWDQPPIENLPVASPLQQEIAQELESSKVPSLKSSPVYPTKPGSSVAKPGIESRMGFNPIEEAKGAQTKLEEGLPPLQQRLKEIRAAEAGGRIPFMDRVIDQIKARLDPKGEDKGIQNMAPEKIVEDLKRHAQGQPTLNVKFDPVMLDQVLKGIGESGGGTLSRREFLNILPHIKYTSPEAIPQKGPVKPEMLKHRRVPAGLMKKLARQMKKPKAK